MQKLLEILEETMPGKLQPFYLLDPSQSKYIPHLAKGYAQTLRAI
jgi:hypothetical protein